MTEKKANSFLDRLRKNIKNTEHYGGHVTPEAAKMDAADCPNCGAARARQDGLTQCAYCGFAFMKTELTDGLFLTKEDNSK